MDDSGIGEYRSRSAVSDPLSLLRDREGGAGGPISGGGLSMDPWLMVWMGRSWVKDKRRFGLVGCENRRGREALQTGSGHGSLV